jgi:hypothetical protein
MTSTFLSPGLLVSPSRCLSRKRDWLIASFSALCMVIAGCGASDRGRVSGTVLRKDGTPLATARVIARSTETGLTVYGTTDSDGKFALSGDEQSDGIPAGDYDVVILEDRGNPDERRPPSIAAKYRDPATSGLTLSVEAGESKELNLTLDPS